MIVYSFWNKPRDELNPSWKYVYSSKVVGQRRQIETHDEKCKALEEIDKRSSGQQLR